MRKIKKLIIQDRGAGNEVFLYPLFADMTEGPCIAKVPREFANYFASIPLLQEVAQMAWITMDPRALASQARAELDFMQRGEETLPEERRTEAFLGIMRDLDNG